MNAAVSSIWRQLVRRRLWPVAILLVAALAAVPVLLARDPEVPIPPVDPAPAVTSKADDAIAEPVVAAAAPEERSKRRRVLGVVKDPFAPAPPKKAKKKAAAKKADSAESGGKSESAPTGGSSSPDFSTGSGGFGGGTLTPSEPVAPKTYYAAGTIVVRFGVSSQDELDRFAIKKLGPVPNQESPLLIYMGLTKDGKRAKFLVDAAIEVDGDGTCRPHPSSCETVELSVGETEFLDVINPDADEDATGEERVLAQFQLDLVDIKRAGDDDVR